jgi:acyl dehydratase
MSKTNAGNFFEDFTVGRVLNHATPLTLTQGRRQPLPRALWHPVCRAIG